MVSIIRTSVSFFILMFVSLWVGKQVYPHKDYFNFALSITIISFIANMGFDTKLNFISMMAAVIALIILSFFVSLITSSSRRFRGWLSGKPTVIIENGEILGANMKRIKYTVDDLNQQLREQGIFDIFEVEYALLEISGKLSVLKKTRYQNVTKMDANPNIPNREIHFPKELIMDGTVVEKNFTSQYSSQWLDQELKKRNMQLKDIQYAVISSNEFLFIDRYDDDVQSPLGKK